MADDRGLNFTFKDAGEYVGSPALATVHSLGTAIRAVRYNKGGNRFIGVDLLDRAGNKWNNIATFDQNKQNNWGYNVGDVAITVLDDGAVVLMTNAGDVGGSEIKEAWLTIPPHITGIPATDLKQAVNFQTGVVDQFARDQISGITQRVTGAAKAASDAQEAVKNVLKTIKEEIEKRMKNITAGVSEQKVKEIMWSSFFAERLFIEIDTPGTALRKFVVATSQYWAWVKGRDAAAAVIKEQGLHP